MYIFKENKITPYDINFNEKYVSNSGSFTLDVINRYNDLVSSRFNKSISHDEFMNDIDNFKLCLSHDEFVKIKRVHVILNIEKNIPIILRLGLNDTLKIIKINSKNISVIIMFRIKKKRYQNIKNIMNRIEMKYVNIKKHIDY